MRTIVTVTECQSPGRFKCSALVGAKRVFGSDVFGPEAAAAEAMRLACAHGPCGYHIFAPAAVLAKIPADMRGR